MFRTPFALVALLFSASLAPALELQLPLARKAYQTNESIELAVVRSGNATLAAGEMSVTATAAAGGSLAFVFAVPEVPLFGKEARRTELVHLNGRLLRPGNYTIEVKADGQTASAMVEVYSHIRKSSFKLVDWGSRATGAEQAALGEDGMGFNVLLASYGGLSADDVIRAGMDYMWCCTMSGGHQMDLRLECDWSDPLVLRGGTARVVRRAFQDRTNPNCIGVHFYDEPGLTWHKHPVTGEFTPHGVPAQVRAYNAAFGKNPPEYNKVDPKSAKDFNDWLHWGRWKLGFMEAAWKDAAFGVNRVRSDLLSVNQAVYGWNAYTDGYYFNISRPLPILGGHGGYDDFGALYFNPSWFLEFGRARDLARPNWYLPTWYEGTPPLRFRMEQYLSFMNNIQGMMKPPDMQVHRPWRSSASEGIVESNKLMAKLGTIFTTMPVTRPPVAVLCSMSQNLRSQAKDRSDNYEGGGQRNKTMFAYLAGKAIHQPLFPVVEEDILDGSLVAQHKAILLPGTNELDPKVVRALEEYIVGGGRVLLSDDATVAIKGAVKVGAPIDTTFSDTIAKLWKENKQTEIAKVNTVGNMLKSNEKFAAALKAKLMALDIAPLVECDNPGVVVSRQGGGDVEYVFAVNTSFDADTGERMALKSTSATLKVAGKAGVVYDAISGGKAEVRVNQKGEQHVTSHFGPGQMKVYAVTSEPLEVKLSRPLVRRDFTVEDTPLSVEAAASVHGLTHMLAGSVPLRIRLIDAHGQERYDLYRATDNGVCQIKLPLAANDPSGTWRLQVRELLGGDEQTLVFELANPRQCGAAAGTVARALSFGNDRDNIYRFFRTWKDVTLVKGSSDYNAAAARLQKALAPWGVRFKIVNAADIKPRELSAEEAATWVGLQPGKAKPGKDNPPGIVGFDIRGPVLLLGTPEDNPLIAFLEREHFLPYKPVKGALPGMGRGYLAWQRDGISYDQESVTLIAHDAAGMSEAVGTLAEVVAGLRPLMPKEPPLASQVEPVGKWPAVPQLKIVWEKHLPDRIVGFSGHGPTVSADGTLLQTGDALMTSWRVLIKRGELLSAPADVQSFIIVPHGSTWSSVLAATGEVVFDSVPAAPGESSSVNLVVAFHGANTFAIGTTAGSLSLFDVRAVPRWTIRKSNDAKAPPNPYVAAAFADKGEYLLGATVGELHVINVAEGKIEARVPGIKGRYGLIKQRDWFVVSDGGNIKWYSPKSKKFERTMPLPSSGLAKLFSADGDAILVASETDGALRFLKYVKEGTKPEIIWEHVAAGQVPKLMQKNPRGFAVAYWGGLFEAFDLTGKLIAAMRFETDITAVGFGDSHLIGLADGRVIAVK